jgi:hypothetical protein
MDLVSGSYTLRFDSILHLNNLLLDSGMTAHKKWPYKFILYI